MVFEQLINKQSRPDAANALATPNCKCQACVTILQFSTPSKIQIASQDQRSKQSRNATNQSLHTPNTYAYTKIMHSVIDCSSPTQNPASVEILSSQPSPSSPYSPRQVDIFLHDGDAFRVYRAQICVFEEMYQKSL